MDDVLGSDRKSDGTSSGAVRVTIILSSVSSSYS